MDKLSKVKDLKIQTAKSERNNLKLMNLQRKSFVQIQMQITAHIKGNESSMYKDKYRRYPSIACSSLFLSLLVFGLLISYP